MRSALAVLVGGAIGTGLRLALDLLLPHPAEAFPVSTLVANTVGAALLGFAVARWWPRLPEWARAGVGAGILGSFTTFSAVAVSLVSIAGAGLGWLAVGYLAATLVLGLAAAWAGLRLGRPRGPVPIDEVDE